MKIIVDLVIILAAFGIIHIAFHFLIIEKEQQKRIDAYEEENHEQNNRLNDLTKRVIKLENRSLDEKRDNTRKNKTSSKSIR